MQLRLSFVFLVHRTQSLGTVNGSLALVDCGVVASHYRDDASPPAQRLVA